MSHAAEPSTLHCLPPPPSAPPHTTILRLGCVCVWGGCDDAVVSSKSNTLVVWGNPIHHVITSPISTHQNRPVARPLTATNKPLHVQQLTARPSIPCTSINEDGGGGSALHVANQRIGNNRIGAAELVAQSGTCPAAPLARSRASSFPTPASPRETPALVFPLFQHLQVHQRGHVTTRERERGSETSNPTCTQLHPLPSCLCLFNPRF
jgi:hypothetical protein